MSSQQVVTVAVMSGLVDLDRHQPFLLCFICIYASSPPLSNCGEEV